MKHCNNIKIMIFTHSLHVGGAEKHVYDLITQSDKEKYKFIVVCLYELGSLGKMLSTEHRDVDIHYAIMKNKFDLMGIIKLVTIMRNEKADILYIVHTPLTLFWGMICGSLTGIKATLTRFTSTYPVHHIRRRRIVNYLALASVDVIIAQAQYHREYLISQEHVDAGKIVVINNGVNEGRFDSQGNLDDLRKSLKVPDDVPVIGIVAHLRPEKGHKTFFKAAQRVLELFPSAVFLIVGDGRERNRLENFVGGLGIGPSVHFLGLRKDISQILALFDVAVLSSHDRVETFSNAILEYMAASKPVVATNVGSIAEQVVNGKTGYLVPCEDADAMADAIKQFLKDRELAKRMGQAGRELVEQKFSIQTMIKAYDSLFTHLLESKR